MRGETRNGQILFHIVLYCEYIAKIISDCVDYEKFIDPKNKKDADVCAFYVGQIGELVKKLTDKFKAEHSDIPWHKIVGLRNRIFHDYFSVDKKIMWDDMTKYVPELNEKCREWLFALDPEAEADLREELAEEGILDPK